MNQYDFHGQVAVVTGGASGIGAAVVQELQRSGARVAVLDLNTDASLGDVSITVDVSRSKDVQAAIDRVIAELGGLQILVCAAGFGSPAETLTTTDDQWRRVYAVNVDGTFYACRAALGHMRAAGYGRVVNIASIAGRDGTSSAAYSGSKAAVIGFTKFLGKESAPFGVTVNSITPGPIKTPLLDALTPDQMALQKALVPAGRLGEPEEVAKLVAYLASADASFSTGACFDVSGGRSLV